MKSLFVKQKMCYGGPWASFKYADMTPRKILEKTYAKGGHPVPMINLLGMDCAVLDLDIRYDWLNLALRDNPHLGETLLSTTEGIKKLDEVNFAEYDLVYSEDPILPQHIISDCPDTVFAYNPVEHTDPKAFSQTGVEYDLFYWHVPYDPNFHWNRSRMRKGLFPQAPDIMRNEFKGSGKKIHLEYRTVEAEGGRAHKYLEQHTELQCTYYGQGHKIYYMVENPPKNAVSYWERLADSKYNIMLPARQGVRLGQSLGDAASMGVINIGKALHSVYLHPRCRVGNLDEALGVIRDIETTSDLGQQIIEYQDDVIKKSNDKFINMIKDKISEKRGL